LPPQQSPGDVLYSIRKDQLKKNDSASLPMPKELKKSFGLVLAALKRGDRVVWGAVEGPPRNVAMARREDIASSRRQEKVVSLDRLANEIKASPRSSGPGSPRRSADVSREAIRLIERSHLLTDLKSAWTPPPKIAREAVAPALRDMEFNRNPAAGLREAASPPSFRFRDWNPDVRTAISLGVEISYLSRTNEVACPKLGLSSRHINPAMQTRGTSGGFSPAGGSSSSHGSGSAAGAASHSGGHSHSSGSSSGSSKKN
jgi:hypothetical protein